MKEYITFIISQSVMEYIFKKQKKKKKEQHIQLKGIFDGAEMFKLTFISD